MKFELEIEMGNEAMGNLYDVQLSLRAVADRVEGGRKHGKIMDRNGNAVGSWKFAD